MLGGAMLSEVIVMPADLQMSENLGRSQGLGVHQPKLHKLLIQPRVRRGLLQLWKKP